MSKSTTLRIDALHIRLRDAATGETQEIVYDGEPVEPGPRAKAAKAAKTSPAAANDEPAEEEPRPKAAKAAARSAESSKKDGKKPAPEARVALTLDRTTDDYVRVAVTGKPVDVQAWAKAHKTLLGQRWKAPNGIPFMVVPYTDSLPKDIEREIPGVKVLLGNWTVPDSEITLRLDNATIPGSTKILAVGRGATSWIKGKTLLGSAWARDDKGAPSVIVADTPQLVDEIKAAHSDLALDLAAYTDPMSPGADGTPGDLTWQETRDKDGRGLEAVHGRNRFTIRHSAGDMYALFYVWGPKKYTLLSCGKVGELKQIAAERGPMMPDSPTEALAIALCRSCRPGALEPEPTLVPEAPAPAVVPPPAPEPMPEPEPPAAAKSRGPSKPRTKSKAEPEPSGQPEPASPVAAAEPPLKEDPEQRDAEKDKELLKSLTSEIDAMLDEDEDD